MAETGAIFGGEHSAHYYFRDFWGADSGMLAALHVLAALGEQQRPLSELMADYQRYEESGEINFTVADAPGCVDAVLTTFGSRIQSPGPPRRGHRRPRRRARWFNPRTSNTEPLLRLNVEARTTEEVDEVAEHGGETDCRTEVSRVASRFQHVPGLPTIDLDDVEGLLAADREGLLRASAMAGAQCARHRGRPSSEGALELLRSDTSSPHR